MKDIELKVGKRYIFREKWSRNRFYEAKVIELSPSRNMVKLSYSTGLFAWEEICDLTIEEEL